jgi:hypothetical protein
VQHIQVRARCPDTDRTDAFHTLADFSVYPQLTDSVRRVELSESDGEHYSDWEVNFRAGILEWRERDRFDEHGHEITFARVSGDPDEFKGSWSVAQYDGGCEVTFDASFEIDLAGFGELLDDVVEQTLYDNIVDILRGLLGDDIEILTDRPRG